MDDMLYLVIMWAGVFISYNLANHTKLTPVLFFLPAWQLNTPGIYECYLSFC